MHTDEILDLVNDNDEVISNMLRSEVYKKGLRNFRGVNCFLVNKKGELWIPRRPSNKRIFPDCLDFSVAGHVESGETYFEALVKEAKEELNLDVTKLKVKELGKLTPKDGSAIFEMCYEINYDKVPNYNKHDFVSGEWLTPKELEKRIEGGEKVKSDLPVVLKHFYKVK